MSLKAPVFMLLMKLLPAYIELKGLEGHSEASRHRRVDPQRLFDDTACVFQLLQGLDVQAL